MNKFAEVFESRKMSSSDEEELLLLFALDHRPAQEDNFGCTPSIRRENNLENTTVSVVNYSLMKTDFLHIFEGRGKVLRSYMQFCDPRLNGSPQIGEVLLKQEKD
ncbi:hypothetical protein HHI36_014979 [Cryptolaemus montrouzieri]|uniref:Uncharacterized protein n=1 Tax=Cryptolaemus montrouzieri TaxID=559131 RepID=A0ABD2N4C6_9CUCU